VLTGGVVAFGFAAIALAGGFMAQSLEGLREGTIRNGVGHVQLARPEAFGPGGDAGGENGFDRAAEVERILRQDPDVLEVLPRVEFAGLVSNGSRTIPFLGVGVDPAGEARAMDLPRALAEGRWLTGGEDRGVVLGARLAAALAVEAGDTVTLLATTTDGTLNAVDAPVVGLADIPIREMSERFLAASRDVAGELLDEEGRVSRPVVVLRDGNGARAAALRFESSLRSSGFDLAARPWEELATFYRQVRVLYLAIFGFMGAVLVAVVLLATANTMTMAAAERTREIGTLRALGTRPSRIRAMFLAEGATLAVAGCVIGTLVALLLRALLNRSGIELPPPPGASHGMPLHVKLYGAAYAAGAVLMLVTLLCASYFPARRASRMAIVEALAHV
jgi:putative ABC transport system permease protein